ncbi:MAG: methylmalonyl-CoA mutase family protein [Firmicutes bacterium]|nr:methylmalonyl-CoA mutase family protein [Bacillota bacterium]
MAKEAGDRIMVGVNKFNVQEELAVQTFTVDPEAEQRQIERTRQLKAQRDNALVQKLLDDIRRTADSTDNIVPVILEAVKAYATEGEVMQALKDVFGEYQEQPIF